MAEHEATDVVDTRPIGAIADAIHRELDEAVWHVENMGQAASSTVSERCAAVYYLSRSFVLLGGMVVDAEIVEPERDARPLERSGSEAEQVRAAALAVWQEADARGLGTNVADALAECVTRAFG